MELLNPQDEVHVERVDGHGSLIPVPDVGRCSQL